MAQAAAQAKQLCAETAWSRPVSNATAVGAARRAASTNKMACSVAVQDGISGGVMSTPALTDPAARSSTPVLGGSIAVSLVASKTMFFAHRWHVSRNDIVRDEYLDNYGRTIDPERT